MSTLGDAADVNPANSKTQNASLLPVHAMFRHDCPLAVKPASTPRHLVHKKTWRDSLPIDMLLSAVSVLVVARPSSEVPEGLMNYPLFVSDSAVVICVRRSWPYEFWAGVSHTVPLVTRQSIVAEHFSYICLLGLLASVTDGSWPCVVS